MVPPSLVLRRRRDDRADRATPTTTTFLVGDAATQRAAASAHGFSDGDYDDGDILDELLQETPTAAAPPQRLCVETLRGGLPVSPLSPDTHDAASTCSSTTAAEDDEDDDVDDYTSITSMSASSVSAASAASARAAIVAPKTRQQQRRRRRRNRRWGSTATTAVPSEAGSTSPGLPPKSMQHLGLEADAEKPRRTSAADPDRPAARPSPKASKTSKTSRPKKAKPAVEPTSKSKSSKLVDADADGGADSAATTTQSSRHPRLQIGLDLDVELQLKSKVRGDICLTLVLEETQKVAPRASPEIRRNAAGNYVAYDDDEDGEDAPVVRRGRKATGAAKGKKTATRAACVCPSCHGHGKDTVDNVIENVDDAGDDDDDGDVEEVEVTRIATRRAAAKGSARREICHLRVGRLNLTRRWWMDGYERISQFPPPVVAGVAVAMPVAGFAAGYAAAQWAGIWPW